jgi:type I restriction enzyme S subunit
MTIEQRPLPPGWRWMRLGEVCEFLDSQRIPINETERRKRIAGKQYSDLYPYFGANGQVGWIDGFLFSEPLILLAEDGGFFGSHERPVAYLATGKYWVNNHAHVLRPLPIIDLYFLLHSLRIRPDIGGMISGSTRGKLNQEVASQIPIILPPIAEQKRIVAILEAKMAAVERARIAAKTQLAAVQVLPAAFLRQVFPHPGQPIPDDWRWVRLGEVCVIKGGKRLPFGTALVGHCTPFPYIRVVDFTDGTVDTRNLRYLDEVTQSLISHYTIGKDDVYISIAGSIGIVGTIPDFLDGANLTENAAKLVICDKSDLSRDYLARFLMSSMGQASISERTNTVGQPKLALTRIATIPIPLPPLFEQQQIAGALKEQIAVVEKACSTAEAQLESINHLPAAYLRRAFSGGL